MKLLLGIIVISIAGCSHHVAVQGQTPRDWLSTSNVQGCIQKQCASSGDDADRASCESACRQTYGR